jgi:hypothetical protein
MLFLSTELEGPGVFEIRIHATVSPEPLELSEPLQPFGTVEP